MILVTGATSITGKALVHALSANAISTRALVRNLDKAADLSLPHVEIVVADLLQPNSLAAALEGVTAVYLLSSGTPDSVTAQKNLIDAAKNAGVTRVVKHSGMGASHESSIQLAQWHAEIEDYLAASGLEFTVLRPQFYFQNLLMDAAMIKAEGVLYAPMSDAVLAPIDARDIALAALTVLTTPGHHCKYYELTGPAAINYTQIAAALGATRGKPVQYIPIDFDSFTQGARDAGMPEWLAADVTQLFRGYAQGSAATVSPALFELTGSSGRTLQNFAHDYQSVFA